jgi:hypothetical protein
MEDTFAATKGQVYQRRSQTGYNDAGWEIWPGNYSRFITQIDPDGTSIGLFRIGGPITTTSPIYSRFARSFENASGKNAMYFDCHDELFSDTPEQVELSVIYYDSVANSTWELQYDAGSNGFATALSVTNLGDSTWKTVAATVTNAVMQNNGPNGSDFALINTDALDDIFHMVEVQRSEPLINERPIANAGVDQTVSAGVERTATVTLDGTESWDPDMDPLTYYWEWPGGSAEGGNPELVLPLGTNVITLFVSDGIEESSDTVTVTVIDTTPPSMSISAAPSILWPPTHKMEPVEVTILATDNCDPNPKVQLDSITMNEGGYDDCEIIDTHQVMLRSERAGNQQDRIYTLNYIATDFSGNSTAISIDITVPHDQRGKKSK